MYVFFLPICLCMTHIPGTHGSLKRVSHPPGTGVYTDTCELPCGYRESTGFSGRVMAEPLPAPGTSF